MKNILVLFIPILILVLSMGGCTPTSTQPPVTSNSVSFTSSSAPATPSIYYGGALLYPPPWPNVSYYYDPNVTIVAKVGKEFAVGFDTNSPMGWYWTENHDENLINIEDTRALGGPPPHLPNTTWFLFKSIQTGITSISFTYHGNTGDVRSQVVFKVEIN